MKNRGLKALPCLRPAPTPNCMCWSLSLNSHHRRWLLLHCFHHSNICLFNLHPIYNNKWEFFWHCMCQTPFLGPQNQIARMRMISIIKEKYLALDIWKKYCIKCKAQPFCENDYVTRTRKGSQTGKDTVVKGDAMTSALNFHCNIIYIYICYSQIRLHSCDIKWH